MTSPDVTSESDAVDVTEANSETRKGPPPRMAFNWRLVAALLLVVGLVGVVFVSLLYGLTGGEIPFDHAVIIDAGSSHSGILLYKWQGDKYKGTGQVVEIHECGVEPGISSYSNPRDAGESLLPCLKEASDRIPEEKRANTPVYLGATAGMRLLNVTNPYQSLATFTAVHCAIPKSSMIPMTVGIISGPAEGLFAWITTNYLLGSLQRKEHPTVGAADMGGASTQIAFEVPMSANNSKVISLKLYGEDYHVYSVTYLCYGSLEIFRRYLASLVKDHTKASTWDNPCGNRGQTLVFDATYLFDQPCTKTRKLAEWIFLNPNDLGQNYTFEGTADSEKCRELVSVLFDPKKCSTEYDECFQPIDPLDRPEKFMAFSSYYWTMDFMDAKEKSLEDFQQNVIDFCNRRWENITAESYPSAVLSVLPRYCFQGHMVDIILTDEYGYNSSTWTSLQFAKKVNDASVGWALGYMINATNAIPEELPTTPVIGLGVFIVLLLVCIGLLVAGAVFCARAKRKAKRVTSSQLP